MKNSNDTIGTRTRDLPTCGAVPQPTAPPRNIYSGLYRNSFFEKSQKLCCVKERGKMEGCVMGCTDGRTMSEEKFLCIASSESVKRRKHLDDLVQVGG